MNQELKERSPAVKRRRLTPTSDLISHQLVKYLEDRGVEYIFGLCGHTNIAVLAALANSSVKFINTRHEQVAAHMADGYARAKRTTAVVLSHLGPGLTNASTGVANAALDSIPMVVIAGDVPSHYYGKHPHQEVNLHADAAQYEIYKPFVKRAWRVERPDLFPEILEKAFQLAESGRPGPVLVSVPMDIFSMRVDVALFERLRNNTKKLHKPSIDEEVAEKIVRTLAEAKSPVVYAGGGVILADAAKELKEFVSHLALPVAHSLMGKGVIPDDHPLVLGMTGFWGTKFINEKCRSADYIFAVGTRFAEADCSSWEDEYTFSMPPTRLIHIDIDSNEIGRNYPVEIGVVTDLKQALTVLLRVAKRLYPSGRKNEKLVNEIAAYRKGFRQANEDYVQQRGLSDAPGTHPRCSARGFAARCIDYDRCGLEQERRRSAVSGVHARQHSYSGRFRDDGVRCARCVRRETRVPRQGSGRARGRRWLWSKSRDVGYCFRGRHCSRLDCDEQLRVRNYRWPGDGPLRNSVRLCVSQERSTLLARFRGDRACVWRRRRADQIG